MVKLRGLSTDNDETISNDEDTFAVAEEMPEIIHETISDEDTGVVDQRHSIEEISSPEYDPVDPKRLLKKFCEECQEPYQLIKRL